MEGLVAKGGGHIAKGGATGGELVHQMLSNVI